jgi:hypothetical protein
MAHALADAPVVGMAVGRLAMSTEPLEWTRVSDYCLQAPPSYSICGIGGAKGWSYECWIGREQRKVGLRSPNQAKAWCQRHRDQSQETAHADVEQAEMLVGE